MDIARKPIVLYSLLISLLSLFPLSSALAASSNEYCPYTTTSKCAAWLSSKDKAYDFANNLYWKYKDFVNPFGVLNLEMKVLKHADKMHLFKDNRTEQNTLNTQWLNTYTKLSKKTYYNTRVSRQEFYVFHGNHVFHVMTKAESRVSKSGQWQSSKNCIAIDGIWDCYSTKNSGWSWW